MSSPLQVSPTCPSLVHTLWSLYFLKDILDHLILLLKSIPTAFKKNNTKLPWMAHVPLNKHYCFPSLFHYHSYLKCPPLLLSSLGLPYLSFMFWFSRYLLQEIFPWPSSWPPSQNFAKLPPLTLAQHFHFGNSASSTVPAYCRWMNAGSSQRKPHREDVVELTLEGEIRQSKEGVWDKEQHEQEDERACHV